MKKTTPALLLLGSVAILFFIAACGGGGGGDSSPGPIVLVSVNSAGFAASDDCEEPAVSADGRYVAFYSYADNLVPDDTNEDYDIFLNDTETGITSRVSVSSAGSEGFGSEGSNASYYPAISGDGRYVAFEGEPINFVPDDDNDSYDIFLRDTHGAITSRVSVSAAGTEGNMDSYKPAIGYDGRYVAFYSESDNLVPGLAYDIYDVFVRDTQLNITSQASVSTAGSQGNADSSYPDISPDGRYVVFESFATNLVAGSSDGNKDIYLRDTVDETTVKVSVSTTGMEGNGNSYDAAVISDGRYVAFHSNATNLVSGDDNGWADVYLRDVQDEITSRVSVSTAGTQANHWSGYPDISGDGRYVVFQSLGSTLVPDDTNGVYDIFVRDTVKGTTTRLSVSAAGEQANNSCDYPKISTDGRYVVFQSKATNLVSDPVPSGAPQIYRAPVHP
jgi:hypothetical protein